MSGIIYQITNKVTNDFYVGLTTQTLARRWAQHCSAAKSANLHFSRAIRAYGRGQFVCSILEMVEDVSLLPEREQYWIAILRPPYNSTAGGEGLLNPSPETRTLMSERQRGHKNHFYGRHHTLQTRRRISERNKGRIHTAEHCERIRKGHVGLKHTPETKAKMSAAHRHRVFSDETRAKMRVAARDAWQRRRQQAVTTHPADAASLA